MQVGEFEEELRGEGRKHFYLVKGPEPLKVGACVRATRGLLDPEVAAFNYQSFRLIDDKVEDILDQVRSSSFFPQPRVALVRSHPTKKIPAPEVDLLLKWIARPDPSATVVLLHPRPGDSVRLGKAARAAGMEVECPAPTKYELPDWVAGVFAGKGLTLNKEGARVLLERAGDDLDALVSEAEKMSLYPGPGKPITPKVIRELVSLNPSGFGFELAEPVALGAAAKAAYSALELQGNTPPNILLASLATHFLRVLSVRLNTDLAREAGDALPTMALADRLGLNEFYVANLRRQAEKWPPGKLRKAMAALEAAQRAYVTTVLPKNLILEGLAMGFALLSSGESNES
jgi:DNA polymerase III delta subunit